ncbi:hypothetical protein APR04_005245 [Promicromonospora umidemergens]|uniref:Transmembrane protein n=1 Tax=Promicromonospora umidemergens TaxID=629679 RepID=A0ABP8XU49_9MICO|nr:hypothetical protein [Promicromonospora umidemergens]MCP2286308.1 hypothetical protein [Promicromonospora umidemergens]
MESESTGPPSADVALAGIADDRRALVREVTRTNAWYYLAVALLAAIMVWAPAIGSVGQFTVVMALGTMALVALESLRERTSGVAMSRPPGRRGWAILIAVGVVFIALIAASFALVVTGRGGLALLCAAVAFAAMFVLAWLYNASFIAQRRAS